MSKAPHNMAQLNNCKLPKAFNEKRENSKQEAIIYKFAKSNKKRKFVDKNCRYCKNLLILTLLIWILYICLFIDALELWSTLHRIVYQIIGCMMFL